MRRIIKIAALVSAVVVAIVGSGLLALTAGRMNPYLRDYAQQRLTRDLGVAVHIGRLDGNPLSGFRLDRVRFGTERDPLAVVDAVEVRYRPSALLRGALIVDEFLLTAPKIRLPGSAAVADSAVRVLPESDPHWWKNGPKREIRIRHAEVVDGRIELTDAGRIDSLNLVLGLRAGPAGYELALRRLQSLVFDPPVVVRDLSGLTLLADGRMALEGIRLNTAGSGVRIDGTITGLARPRYDVMLRADSLAFDELGRVLPGTYPTGSLAAGGRVWGDVTRTNLDLKLDVGSTVGFLSGYMDFSRPDIGYDIRATATGVDLMRIAPRIGLDARFDAAARLRGHGLDPFTAEAAVSAGISRATFSGVVVDTGNLAVTLKNGRVGMDLSAEGPAGRVATRLAVELADAEPLYELSARVDRLDLSSFPGTGAPLTHLTGGIQLRRADAGAWRGGAVFDLARVDGLPEATGLALRGSFRKGIVSLDSIGVRLSDGFGVVRGHGRIDLGRFWDPDGKQPSYIAGLRVDGLSLDRLPVRSGVVEDVSLQIGLAGRGLHPDSTQANADVILGASRFLGGNLDSARASLVQQGRRTIVNRLFLAGTHAHVEGNGWIVPGDSLDVRVTGRIDDFSALDSVIDHGLSGTPASFSAGIRGTWTKHLVVADLLADSVNYKGVPIRGIRLGMKGPELSRGDVEVRADSLVWGGRTVYDVSADLDLNREGITFVLGSRPDEIDQLHLRGGVAWADAIYVLELDSLAIGVGGVSLCSDGASRITYRSREGVFVERFRLVGDGGAIQAHGHSAREDGVVVSLIDVDLKIWSGFLRMAGELSGMLSGTIALSGTPEDPRVRTELAFRDGAVAGVRLKEASGTLGYRNHRATVDLRLVQSHGREATANGEFPLNPSSAGPDDLFPPGPVDVSLKSAGIDMNFLPHVFPAVQDAQGVLAADVEVKGTPERLLKRGWLTLRDGKARIVPLNTNFENVAADLEFDGNRIVLQRFETGKEKTRVTLKGEVALDRFDLARYDLTLHANEFEAVDLASFKATLNADLQLKGDLGAGRLDGGVALSRAVLRLSDFIEYPTDVGWMSSPLFRNLVCDVRVSASQNVWIRDRELNVEISGDVDLVKDNEGIRLYGSLDSRQGRYEFQNTSFAIDRGEINFRGSADINPDLYIIATRRIRLVSNENAVISVVVGGTLLEPNISLESDTTPPLDESDILSYLLIGRPADEVSGLMSGEGGAGSRLEGQAAVLVLGVAANQLKRTIGRRLNLDVVEIDLGLGSSATRVRAGKYFGSRFFVSYAQDVSEARGREVVVEYELLPNVTLEAQQREGNERERDRSSLGIFWKKEW
ncbi:MAG: translocation/assembly module TamB domain-containing protein [Gemmatimonadota bacterium]|nr:translocation/assembly module TamB domain-containing protein [Gemmatimonadota bacterium]